MAVVFLSKSVRHAHSARPSLLRPLLWTIGVQAALGGTLVMIHDEVFSGGRETGAVTMNFVDAGEDSGGSDVIEKQQIRALPPVDVPVRMEERQPHKEMPLLTMNEVPVPDGIPNAGKSDSLCFNDEDFGALLPSGGDAHGAKRKQSGKSKGKGMGSSTSSLATTSGIKGNSAVTSARYKSAPLPPYPRSAKSEGREGVVMLKLLINEEGSPTEVCLAKSSGSSVLDDAALDWVKNNWLFYPATDGTRPVESAMIAPLRFKLNS